MQSLTDRITRAPLAHDPARARALIATLDPGLRTGRLGALLGGTAGSSPYLVRLIERHRDWLTQIHGSPPETVMADILATLENAAGRADGQNAVGIAMREAKSRAALLIALADLGGAWDLAEVTGALTRLADRACEVAARWLLAREAATGRLPEFAAGDAPGYMLIAMGKMGAGELNYSSDIDLIALFDDGRFGGDDVMDARARYIHVTRQLVKLISENTAQGYVFRTDLRLRPTPSTTPVCMAIEAAERYYESVGRTWERAAHIKARPLVDRVAGRRYLGDLAPFIWRRHLDFAAIDDIHEMLRKIRDKHARFTVGSLPGHDLKLGPGGIREIEFFAQTRQLIMGGRNPTLRAPTTIGALAALTGAGVVDAEVRDLLSADYTALRTIEHRLQMMEDAQTQIYPTSEDGRSRLAALCGERDQTAFESALAERLRRVNTTTREFFGSTRHGRPASTPDLTEIDEASLAEAGFERPADAVRQITRWREGGISATRSERAQALYLGLESQILSGLAGARAPDQALNHFDRFLSGLPAGVQVFSLFSANRNLLDLIVAICAAAPRLAAYIGRRSQTLDALLDRDFWEPVAEAPVLAADLDARLSVEDDYERVLDATRRWSREMQFRTGVQVLRGVVDHVEAGRAHARIAEAALVCLLPHVTADFATRHGPPPGAGLALLAMGKLGSQEMTAGSDLDLITVYDAGDAESSDGPRPLAPRVYYPRLTQALVAALTAPTAEGVLFEVDMRLRPSGRQGPVAVSLSSFEVYQMNEAWVWEHLALTRARVVAGPMELRRSMERIIEAALAQRVGKADVRTETAAMRARLGAAHGADRTRPWALKQAAGGLMDIELAAQSGALFRGLRTSRPTGETLRELAARDCLTGEEADHLAEAFRLQATLQQIERVALDKPFDPETIGSELRRILASAAQQENFAALCEHLAAIQARTAAICDRLFGE